MPGRLCSSRCCDAFDAEAAAGYVILALCAALLTGVHRGGGVIRTRMRREVPTLVAAKKRGVRLGKGNRCTVAVRESGWCRRGTAVMKHNARGAIQRERVCVCLPLSEVLRAKSTRLSSALPSNLLSHSLTTF